MAEKDPCIDCPVRTYLEKVSRYPDVSEVRFSHALRMRASRIELDPKNPEENAVERCDHWHRWGAEFGFDGVAIEALRVRKAKRKPTQN